MPAVTRKQYKGAAAQTTITNALGAGDTSITIAANTGWPSIADVPFFVVISPGTSSEEKCLATISGLTLTLTRAQDDTSAQSHSSGAAIYPVFAADDADEANKLASTLTTRGDLLTMGAGPDFARVGIGAADTVLKSDGTDVSYGTIVAANIASDAVTTAKILNANVTGAKLANADINDQTASYTLVVGDRNKRVIMNVGSASTVTVNNSIFSEGDTIFIANKASDACTITAGAGVTINTSGSLALAQYGGGTLIALSASTFTFFPAGVTNTLSVEFLLVGGGGGGGGGTNLSESGGGGGGAGGFVTGSGIIGRTTYTVKVGAGGAAGTVNLRAGAGTMSSFINGANGGGGGGSTNSAQDGQNGGSGGGSYSNASSPGTGISGEGNNGGNGGTQSGGGGGGSAGVGGNGSVGTGGAGGTATSNNYNGSATNYSGGGGGGGGTTGGTAGSGGGNGGGNDTAGSAATDNLGGGGGGGGDNTSGGAGGSGRVIIRYLTADAAGFTISTTGTVTTDTDGSYTYHQYDSTGTLVVA
jgi:hypothetical protein